MDNEEDLSAQSLFDLVADTLSRFDQRWERVAFMVGDNCSVNQYIGWREGAVPFIGCASHRFALAVRDFIDADDVLIVKVHALMKRLNTIKGRAVLRRVSDLAPVIKNDTRWSSVYAMMSRYVELQPALASLDHDTVAEFSLQELLPTRSENLKISDLLIDMENFQSVTAELQRPTLTLSAVRRLFDHTLDQYPQLKARLLPTATIVNYPALESGLVKLQRNEQLSNAERTACARFKRQCDDDDEAKRDDDDDESFAARALKKRKVVRRAAFVDVVFVPPPSNECERFFSRAKLVYGDLRKSMDPVTLESLMFLHCNRELWDVYAVESVRNGLGRNDSN